MGKLDSLKITESPYAFASFAAKHNALCDLIAGMTGQDGISVTIAERNAIIRGNVVSNVSLSPLTQEEFNDFLVTALSSPGDEQDVVLDLILNYFDQTTVDACGIGPKTYLTLP